MEIFHYISNKDKTLHHAYIVLGDLEESRINITTALQKRGIKVEANPDLTIETYGTFLIDNVSELKNRAQSVALTENGKYFIICAHSITHEAQNALLKILEEPNNNTHFFICVPRIDGIINTIRSRVQIITENTSQKSAHDMKKFVSLARVKRFTYIKDMLDAHEDDDTSGERREEAITFLNELESYLYHSGEIKNQALVLREINRNKTYLMERGASVKMILEEIALLV